MFERVKDALKGLKDQWDKFYDAISIDEEDWVRVHYPEWMNYPDWRRPWGWWRWHEKEAKK